MGISSDVSLIWVNPPPMKWWEKAPPWKISYGTASPPVEQEKGNLPKSKRRGPEKLGNVGNQTEYSENLERAIGEESVFASRQLSPNPKQSCEHFGTPPKDASKAKPKRARRKTTAWCWNYSEDQEHPTGKNTKSELMTMQGEGATSEAPDAHAGKSDAARNFGKSIYLIATRQA